MECESLELIERLVPLIPLLRTRLLFDRGVLAPLARPGPSIVPVARVLDEPAVHGGPHEVDASSGLPRAKTTP